MTLPLEIDPDYFDDTFRLQPEQWQENVENLCRELGIIIESFRAFTDGSNLVASINETLVVKIFPKFHRHQWVSEHRLLQALHSRTQIPVPKLYHFGELDHGWTYVVVEQLPGLPCNHPGTILSLGIERPCYMTLA